MDLKPRLKLHNEVQCHILFTLEVHPRTRHEGPEEEQMYSSTLPSTSALDGDGWSAPGTGRFTPGKDPVPTV